MVRENLIPLEFYQRNTKKVAHELLGHRLVRIVDGRRISGIITETEAYMGIKDKACHSYGGRRTDRVEPMYLEGGFSYVYLIYGLYHCLNVVTQAQGVPEAVLIRSIEIDESLDLALKNRYPDQNWKKRPPTLTDLKELSNGPGKLCEALQIDKNLNAYSFHSRRLFIEKESKTNRKILTTARIGIDYAGEWVNKPLRFVLRSPSQNKTPQSRLNKAGSKRPSKFSTGVASF